MDVVGAHALTLLVLAHSFFNQQPHHSHTLKRHGRCLQHRDGCQEAKETTKAKESSRHGRRHRSYARISLQGPHRVARFIRRSSISPDGDDALGRRNHLLHLVSPHRQEHQGRGPKKVLLGNRTIDPPIPYPQQRTLQMSGQDRNQQERSRTS